MQLAEVSDRITALLKEEKAARAAAEAAAKSTEAVRASLAAGKTFAEAARLAGVKTQPIAGILPSDRKNTEEQRILAAATLPLKEGELGQLQPAPWGAFVPYVEKRVPLTEAQWNQYRGSLSKGLLANEQQLLFLEWLRSSRAAAGIRMLAGNGSPGAQAGE